jgi:hypothetical protein
VKPVFLIGCYGFIFHGSRNLAQLRNFGGGGGVEPPPPHPDPPAKEVNGTNVRGAITKFCVKCREKITANPNELVSTLLEEEEPRRLKRFKPTDLTTRFT